VSERTEQTCADEERDEAVEDPALQRLQEARLPGEIETGMMTGSEDASISATERFEGEMSREEALAPDDADEPPPESEAQRD
jgi:hypothetical protein